MLTTDSVTSFLAQPRITVVGASDEKSNFGGAIYRALKAHGHEVVAVNPNAQQVDGDPSYPDLASVPGALGGVLVMVKPADAVGDRPRVPRPAGRPHLALQGNRRPGRLVG